MFTKEVAMQVLGVIVCIVASLMTVRMLSALVSYIQEIKRNHNIKYTWNGSHRVLQRGPNLLVRRLAVTTVLWGCFLIFW